MELVIISDTHGHHDKVPLPDGDVLIHCGDVSGMSDEISVRKFARWFDHQPHEHKIVIAGNHDKHMSEKWFNNSRYLQDSGIDINGTYFYGSPWTPTFFDWYWMKDRGNDIAERWNKIPDKTDVLITHGPASDTGMLSRTTHRVDAGCEDLEQAIKRVRPTLHCFGHIHEGYGIHRKEGVEYINASICTLDYNPKNAPVLFTI